MSASHSTSVAHVAQPQLSRAMIIIFAIASGLSVANIYFAHPLLDLMSADFGISPAGIGVVVTLTQIGYALGLFFIVPLGDLINRRTLIVTQGILSTLALLGVASAQSGWVLLACMLAVGVLAVVIQVLVAFAANLANPSQRGKVVGMVTSGIVVGLLLARLVSGLVADLAGWRVVYGGSALLTLIMAALLWKILPNDTAKANATLYPNNSLYPNDIFHPKNSLYPSETALPQATQNPNSQNQATQKLVTHNQRRQNQGQQNCATGYPALLGSVVMLFVEEPLLRVRALLALLIFATFNIFWAAVVLPLSAPPLSLSHSNIGLLGLAGIVGALAANRAGHYFDLGHGQKVTGLALVLMLGAWAFIAFLPSSMLALIMGILLLDLAIQAVHVTNQSMIFSIRPEAQSRLVSGYMIFYSLGSAIGAIASTTVYGMAGWWAVCVLGAAVSTLALVFWALTLNIGKQRLLEAKHVQQSMPDGV